MRGILGSKASGCKQQQRRPRPRPRRGGPRASGMPAHACGMLVHTRGHACEHARAYCASVCCSYPLHVQYCASVWCSYPLHV
eukprot:200442-Rhodomonas_salina.1